MEVGLEWSGDRFKALVLGRKKMVLCTRNEVTMKTILADYVCLSVPKLRPPENDNQAQLITRCVNFSEKDE